MFDLGTEESCSRDEKIEEYSEYISSSRVITLISYTDFSVNSLHFLLPILNKRFIIHVYYTRDHCSVLKFKSSQYQIYSH